MTRHVPTTYLYIAVSTELFLAVQAGGGGVCLLFVEKTTVTTLQLQ